MRTPYVNTAHAHNTEYVILTEIKGVGGMLTGLGLAGGMNYHYFRVTIDGRVVADDFLSGIASGDSHGNNGIGVNLPFDDNLRVEVKDGEEAWAARFWVAYVVNSPISGLVRSEPREATTGGKRYKYEDNTYDASGREYIISSLVRPVSRSRIELVNDTVRPSEMLRGTVVLEDESGQLLQESVQVAVRAFGRTRLLYSVDVGQVRGTEEFAWSMKTLLDRSQLKLRSAQQLSLQVQAQLPGYANEANSFLVLGTGSSTFRRFLRRLIQAFQPGKTGKELSESTANENANATG